MPFPKPNKWWALILGLISSVVAAKYGVHLDLN